MREPQRCRRAIEAQGQDKFDLREPQGYRRAPKVLKKGRLTKTPSHDPARHNGNKFFI
jgi:hypothetical protein